jgi:hypothetical protein
MVPASPDMESTMFTITKMAAVGALLLAGTLAANAHAVTGDVATPATNAPAVAAPANATAEPGIVVAVNPQPLPPRRRMR